ncbi:hypothetical protein KUTeg_001019 [Tegillarca granosa]|uniref:UBP-type domain-containing protein n=1 Tax=Tegillarca granosa TaxID=220873 RepID=A0ABQ9FZJ4_TEGGR|nr:hypothetical protein KUTeg_001019 [Tegillarca granosa]
MKIMPKVNKNLIDFVFNLSISYDLDKRFCLLWTGIQNAQAICNLITKLCPANRLISIYRYFGFVSNELMENCKHISRFRPKWNQSLLNPQKWMCYVCGTTESVWACLLCPVVACGRFTEEHALKHFQESKHPLSIEVNNKYVYW